MDKRVYWLWLVLVFGPANNRIWQLSAKMKSTEEFCKALREGKIPELTVPERKRAASIPFEEAERIISVSGVKGIRVLSYECEEYPERLREIANPPAVLFLRGSLDFLKDRFVVCIAGSRTPSEYSQKVTAYIARTMGENGCVIASGLSAGTDILAENIASDCGFMTLGIYGLAIDSFVQGEDADPAECGAMISELHSEMNFPRPKFAERNRLITALCDALVFVEGSRDSRGLELCNSCISQGKLLFVVPPHDITDPRYLGQALLLRRGCRPFISDKDVLFELSHMGLDRLEYNARSAEYTDIGDYSFFTDEVSAEKKEKSSAGHRKKAAAPKPQETPSPVQDLSELDEKEKKIIQLLKEGPMLADEISAKTGSDISETLSALTMLELDDFVVSLPGKRFGLQH